MKESKVFLSEPSQNNFSESVYGYIQNLKEYNFYDGREKPILLEPILVNKEHTKAIVPILERTSDMVGKRVEYIKYISAKKTNDIWTLKLKEGFTHSFSYADDNYPTLTDSSLSAKSVRNFLLSEEIELNKICDEKLFNSQWYAFN